MTEGLDVPYPEFDRFRFVDGSGEPDTVSTVILSTPTDAPRGGASGILGASPFRDVLPGELQLPLTELTNLGVARLSIHSTKFRLTNWLFQAPLALRIQRVEMSVVRVPGTGGSPLYRVTRTVQVSRADGTLDMPRVAAVDLRGTLDFPPSLAMGTGDPQVGGKPRMRVKAGEKKSKYAGKAKAQPKSLKMGSNKKTPKKKKSKIR